MYKPMIIISLALVLSLTSCYTIQSKPTDPISVSLSSTIPCSITTTGSTTEATFRHLETKATSMPFSSDLTQLGDDFNLGFTTLFACYTDYPDSYCDIDIIHYVWYIENIGSTSHNFYDRVEVTIYFYAHYNDGTDITLWSDTMSYESTCPDEVPIVWNPGESWHFSMFYPIYPQTDLKKPDSLKAEITIVDPSESPETDTNDNTEIIPLPYSVYVHTDVQNYTGYPVYEAIVYDYPTPDIMWGTLTDKTGLAIHGVYPLPPFSQSHQYTIHAMKDGDKDTSVTDYGKQTDNLYLSLSLDVEGQEKEIRPSFNFLRILLELINSTLLEHCK